MWLLLALIPAIVLIAVVEGYYAVAKLTYNGFVCRSFAKLDPLVGWVLAPSVTSCLGGRSIFSNGAPWYDSPVFTDASGFRSAQAGGATPVGAIMATGDSYTFGYGVSYAQSYPGQLAALSDMPVVDIASPAYSTAQALLLAERWADRLRPRAIVFLDMRDWARSACRGSTRPVAILKPCYWQSPGADTAELVTPPPGRVERYAAYGVLPGGMIGAGALGWDYFLLSRPVLHVFQGLARLGLVPGLANDFAAVGVDDQAIRRGAVAQLGRLARIAKVPLILIDPSDSYPQAMLDRLPMAERASIHRIGSERWQKEVAGPAMLLAPAERQVPHDDHFGPGTNRLVAAMVLRDLRTLRIAP